MAVILPDVAEEGWERGRLLEALESYRRGLADAPLLRKWSVVPGGGPEVLLGGGEDFPCAEKEGDSEPPLTFVISNEEVDRHGDVVLAQGWQLQAYQRNPVFLWAHDYSRPVIGRADQRQLELPETPTILAGQKG